MSCWDNRGHREGRHGGFDPVISGASSASRNASGNRRNALHEIPRNGSRSGCSRTVRGVARQVLIINRQVQPLGALDKPPFARQTMDMAPSFPWFIGATVVSSQVIGEGHEGLARHDFPKRYEEGCGRDVLVFAENLASTASDLCLEILSFEIILGLYMAHWLALISKLNPGHHHHGRAWIPFTRPRKRGMRA